MKKLTAEHIRKIKRTYKKKGIAKQHSIIMQKYWNDNKHIFNKPTYRKKLAEAKIGNKNPNSVIYRMKKKARHLKS